MFRVCISLLMFMPIVAGCMPAPKSEGPSRDLDHPTSKPDPALSKKYVMNAEPSGGLGVIAVRKQAKDGDTVVVVGRVGGSAKPFTEGRAIFLMVDPSLKPTTECDCPWDFCDVDKKDLAAARLSVKFVDLEGKTVSSGARELFGIQ